MDRAKLIQAQKWIRYQLDSSADFWLDYGMDKVQAGVNAAVDLVHAVIQPEISAGIQLITDPFLSLNEFCSVHNNHDLQSLYQG